MNKLEIFCSTIKYYKIIDKLPNYITPIGLGDNSFPDHWLTEKKGKNISHLNKYYAQLTMYYWIWKNNLGRFNDTDFIGSCEHRLFWLNQFYSQKQKFSISSLYNKLLKPENEAFKKKDIIIPHPIEFKSKSLLQDFEEVHTKDIILETINFLPIEERKSFLEHLNANIFYIGNMFITKKKYFIEYCEIIFPWVDLCYKLCVSKNLCNGYNIRLPVFLAERYSSYWMSKFKSKEIFSFVRLGNFHLSNTINSIINTSKLPFTFYQYPTIYKY